MSDIQKQPPRALRPGEALCKYGACLCIVDAAVGDCGMCCDEAIEARTKRVKPIDAAEKKKNAEETLAWKSRNILGKK